jgi:hypothetical protein
MKAVPLLLESPKAEGRPLHRITSEANDLKNESWLQELIYRRPELLPTGEFDDAFTQAVPVARELPTARGPIDILHISPEGGIVVVETKLWKNPEKHRTVVAQVIDYAKELATWDYDELCEAVLNASRKCGETEKLGLEDKMAAVLESNGILMHEFQESVAASLMQGSFLLLIVGDRISPNIALLTNAIQGVPGLQFQLGLAELQFFQMTPGQDWPLIVVPEVMGRTVEVTRSVVKIEYLKEKPKVFVESADSQDRKRESNLDLELFLGAIPKDLVKPFREAISAWEESVGTIHFTPRMMFFEAEFPTGQARVIRCRLYALTVIQPKAIEEWGGDLKLYDDYLKDLEASPTVLNQIHAGSKRIRYQKLTAHDLRILLESARNLVNKMKS